MNASEMRANIKKRQEWIQATIERERRREEERKAEAAKKPLTLEAWTSTRNIWENTTNRPKEVKLVTCASCGTKVRKRYGNGRCASCLIKGL